MTNDLQTDLWRQEEKRIKNIVKMLTDHVRDEKTRKKLKSSKLSQLQNDFEMFILNNVVDVNRLDYVTTGEIQDKKFSVIYKQDLKKVNVDFSESVGIYTLNNISSGFYICKNLLTSDAQYKWSKVAIEEFSQASHTNITNLENINSNNDIEHSNNDDKSLSSKYNHSEAVNIENTFEITQKLIKLRWVSLGYHYNWTLRMYVQNAQSFIPNDLTKLCRDAASLVGLSLQPEAAIINYYPLNGTMSGHLDDAEHNMEEPIVSFSLGCDCIFLIGGRTKNIKPIAVYLRSGDCVIMSGESRYCYHGVPVIIPSEFSIKNDLSKDNAVTPITMEQDNYNNSVNQSGNKDNSKNSNMIMENRLFIEKYMKSNRININARRVTRNDGLWESKSGSGYQPLT